MKFGSEPWQFAPQDLTTVSGLFQAIELEAKAHGLGRLPEVTFTASGSGDNQIVLQCVLSNGLAIPLTVGSWALYADHHSEGATLMRKRWQEAEARRDKLSQTVVALRERLERSVAQYGPEVSLGDVTLGTHSVENAINMRDLSWCAVVTRLNNELRHETVTIEGATARELAFNIGHDAARQRRLASLKRKLEQADAIYQTDAMAMAAIELAGSTLGRVAKAIILERKPVALDYDDGNGISMAVMILLYEGQLMAVGKLTKDGRRVHISERSIRIDEAISEAEMNRLQGKAAVDLLDHPVLQAAGTTGTIVDRQRRGEVTDVTLRGVKTRMVSLG